MVKAARRGRTSRLLAATGTPIEKTDASTRAVIGDNVSVTDIERR
jgi:hypothetical protein